MMEHVRLITGEKREGGRGAWRVDVEGKRSVDQLIQGNVGGRK